jgi:inner membrane protein
MKLNPLVFKAAAVVAIVMLLAVALSQINYLAVERQSRFRAAVAGVEQSVAARQVVLGPILLAECTESWPIDVGEGKDRRKVPHTRDFKLTIPPTSLGMKTHAVMEPHHRSLFKVNTYAAQIGVHAQWAPLASVIRREQPGSSVACARRTVMVAVADARGIRHASVQAQGDALEVGIGTTHPAYPAGFSAVDTRPLALDAAFVADLTMSLAGTSELGFVPIGGDTRLTMTSDWPHPSFGGRHLPVKSEVRDNGFEARWEVSALASAARAELDRSANICLWSTVESGHDGPGASRVIAMSTEGQAVNPTTCMESFTTSFIDPVNPYSLSDRAIKYGILFIGLTFLAVGMTEVMRRLRVHPIQYLLVGSAISIFFLLLLSLSEHLSFDVSYAIAASACVMLLAFYGRHVLNGWKAGLAFGAGIGVLYAALYALLQMEQTALVIGSVLLFAVLAGVMVLTRRVDWYSLLQTPAGTTLPEAPQSAA